MEASIFKVAFFVVVGFALLGLSAIAATVIVLGLKVAWLWLRAHLGSARTHHAQRL